MDQGVQFFDLMPIYFDFVYIPKAQHHPFFQTDNISIMKLSKKPAPENQQLQLRIL